MNADQEWDRMLEAALEGASTGSDKDLDKVEGKGDEEMRKTPASLYEDALSSGGIPSSSSTEDEQDKNSSSTDEEWAPRLPRNPAMASGRLSALANDNNSYEIVSDAEEAVRQAGLGMSALDLGSRPSSKHPSTSQSTKATGQQSKPQRRPLTILLPAHWDKLQASLIRRCTNHTPYMLRTSLGLYPYPEDMQINATLSPSNPVDPRTIIGHNLSSNPQLVARELQSHGDSVAIIPYETLMTMMSSNHANECKQAWVVPVAVNGDGALVLAYPMHNDPVDVDFARDLLCYHGMSSDYKSDVQLELTPPHSPPLKVRIVDAPVVCLNTDNPLRDFHTQSATIDPFSLTVRNVVPMSSASDNREPFENGCSIAAHLVHRLRELPAGEYILLHRADEALVYVLEADPTMEEGSAEAIDLPSELPAPVTSVKDLLACTDQQSQ